MAEPLARIGALVADGPYFSTGGQHARDMAGLMTSPICRDAMRMGGPLDAPHYMPAGSLTSTDWSDFYGQPIPGLSLIERTET